MLQVHRAMQLSLRVGLADLRPSMGTAVLRFARERILANAKAEVILGRWMPPYFVCARGLHGEVSCNVGHVDQVCEQRRVR